MTRDATATRPTALFRRLCDGLRANVELVLIAAILIALAGYVTVVAGGPGGWLG